jgi:hypothetical protein
MQTLKTTVLLLCTLAAATMGPMIFPAAQAGHGTMAQSAKYFLLPSVVFLILIVLFGWKSSSGVGKSVAWAGLAGMLATIGLEVVRVAGFRMGYMPGNLPRLMGVLLLDRFALGPSPASDLAGWAYHFWNGASFGIMYAIVFGAARRWVGVLYGLGLAVGFLMSPVVLSLGVGYFGLQFSLGFPATVLLAHAVFGLLLGLLSQRFLANEGSLLFHEFRALPLRRPMRQKAGAGKGL